MNAKIVMPTAERARLQRALQDTVTLKGADPRKTVNKAAGYIASFAVASGTAGKIPIANAAQILVNLRAQVNRSSKLFVTRTSTSKTGRVRRTRRRVRRTSAMANEWRGTLAAVIVASINYGGARKLSNAYHKMVRKGLAGSASRKAATAAQFYRLVARFAKKRATSAGFLRSGLFPALRHFKAQVLDAARMRGFKFPPGTASLVQSETKITAAMEDAAPGISKMAPDALRRSEHQVAELFQKWLREDLAQAATATRVFK